MIEIPYTRFSINKDMLLRKKTRIEADEFAGFVLSRMGAKYYFSFANDLNLLKNINAIVVQKRLILFGQVAFIITMNFLGFVQIVGMTFSIIYIRNDSST